MMENLSLDELCLEFKTSYFPPKQRDKVRKKLAEKLKTNYSSPIEKIQDVFTREVHILDQTVIVDDGSERKVYSTCVFENTKRYNCNVCIVSVFGKMSLIRHNSSKKHYKMMQRKTHPTENFNDELIINIDAGMKRVSMSDCYIVKDLLEECQRRNIFHVLIGLEYLVEVLDLREPYYLCLLCDKESGEIDAVMDHLEGFEHKMTYLMLFFPKVYKKLLLLKKETWKVQVNIVVEKIEKKLGRLRPWRHEGALSLKQKKAIRHSIDSGSHLRDNVDLSFAEDIIYNDKVKDPNRDATVFTEFLVNETEDSVNELYERIKGAVYRCKMCKTRVDSLSEKITHPHTGKHLEKTVRGMTVYDSIACTIQSTLDNFPQPLIGTEYIVEYDEQGVFLYHCMLCRKAMNHYDMVTSHLVSKAHRQRYIKHHMPMKDEELRKKSGPVRAEEIEKLLKLVEAKYGRLPPFGCVYSLDHPIDSRRTVKDVISEKIMDGKHFTVDQRGVPRIVFKMPVPLFPKEGQVVAETTKSNKKRKKSNRRSPSTSPNRRRSRSILSSRSLSPVAWQRGLSPEPGPSTSACLPVEQVDPPALVEDWLNNTCNESTSPLRQAFALLGQSNITIESMEKFFAKCDEENYEKVVDHDCDPFFTVNCPLRELMRNDEAFYEIRRCLVGVWLIKLVREDGWDIKSLDIYKDKKLCRMVKVIETGRIIRDVCRPLCNNCVRAMVRCVLDDFPETKDIDDDELMAICLGLVNVWEGERANDSSTPD